jgi:hypothetical protein
MAGIAKGFGNDLAVLGVFIHVKDGQVCHGRTLPYGYAKSRER